MYIRIDMPAGSLPIPALETQRGIVRRAEHVCIGSALIKLVMWS